MANFTTLIWPKRLRVGLICGDLNTLLKTCLSGVIDTKKINSNDEIMAKNCDIILVTEIMIQEQFIAQKIPCFVISLDNKTAADFYLQTQWHDLIFTLLVHSFKT